MKIYGILLYGLRVRANTPLVAKRPILIPYYPPLTFTVLVRDGLNPTKKNMPLTATNPVVSCGSNVNRKWRKLKRNNKRMEKCVAAYDGFCECLLNSFFYTTNIFYKTIWLRKTFKLKVNEKWGGSWNKQEGLLYLLNV